MSRLRASCILMRTEQNRRPPLRTTETPAPLVQGEAKDALNHEFEIEVHRGLSKDPKELPSRFFYDHLGSDLFARITELPEYYLTRCEYEILTAHARDLAAMMPDEPFLLVELGAGDGRKTAVLIDAFVSHDRQFAYIPIDISAEALRSLEHTLRDHAVPIRGIHAEYSAGLASLGPHREPKCLLFLGSNIGNMNPEEAAEFFALLARSSKQGDLCVVGFDLQKEVSRLHAAYNDSEGVTTAFNMNLLERINRELDAGFDLRAFEHYGYYNPSIGAMQSWIVSRKDQSVTIGSRRYAFRRGEGVLVEHSYKYTIEMIESFAERAGFSIVRHFTDAEESFVDSVWRRN